MDYYPMMNGYGWGWGLAMMVFAAVLLIIIIVVPTVVIIRLLKSHDNNTPSRAAPLDTAKMRYAKGEISKEEFEQLKKDL
jgi:putative membrane protein